MRANEQSTPSLVCRLLGGLLLDGANTALLAALDRDQILGELGVEVGGELGAALTAAQSSLRLEGAELVAREFTRLFVASSDGGARLPLLVPPWEDCWVGAERRVLGPRSRAVLRAYVEAGLGFDAMAERPADHVGLELCFVAELYDQEERGERDPSARDAFVRRHLGVVASAVGAALAGRARGPHWRDVGRALVALPSFLGCPSLDVAVAGSGDARLVRLRAARSVAPDER